MLAVGAGGVLKTITRLSQHMRGLWANNEAVKRSVNEVVES